MLLSPSEHDHLQNQPRLVDTHAHLDDKRLRDDLDHVLLRSAQSGVTQIVAIATTAENSHHVINLAQNYQGVFAAVGIHPNEAQAATDSDWTQVLSLSQIPQVVAIGETGLDRYWKDTPFDLQLEWLERHVELARDRDLPLVIHCRDAQKDLIEFFSRQPQPIRGVMHSFTGTWADALIFLEMGFHLSFAGMLTFTNKALDSLREAAARAPVDRILVETDSPYLSPHPFRGKLNEPARTAITAQALAELRGISLAELARITTANARQLFRLPPDQTLNAD
jgi:TatD DNase family protein